MSRTHEEWLVQVKQRYWEEHGGDKWRNAKMWYDEGQGCYAKSRDEAYKILEHAYALWNGTKVYDSNGKRYDTIPTGMLSVAVESTKETDRDLEIVAHRIRKRIVTDWETVEE